MAPRTWFITGASRGLGRAFASAALARGDLVAATARHVESLADLADEYTGQVLPVALDVTDKAAVDAAVTATHERFGHLDVVVNNAGHALFGMVEEISERQLRDQLETTLFGAFHVVRAVLPILREQRRGHIVQISAIGGVVAFPMLGGFHAAKWALEGLTESLSQEIADFGLAVTLVEPGAYATDWAGSSAVHSQPMTVYDGLRGHLADIAGGVRFDDPATAGVALLRVVDAEHPPLRVLFGVDSLEIVRHVYERRLQTWLGSERARAG